MSITSAIVSIPATLLIIIFLKVALGALWNRRKHGPYPPGPKGLPIIGNILDLPKDNQGAVYMNWGKKYNSPIIFASAFGTNILVINKQKDADELFDRRARIYSGRPRIPIAPLLGWDTCMIPLLPYGNYWRLCRKIMQQHFNKEAAKIYEPMILDHVHAMLARLLKHPEKLYEHSKLLSVSITLTMMYGYQARSNNDPLIVAADEAHHLGSSVLTPEASYINVFPVLRFIPPWFPGASSHKIAARTLSLTRMMQNFVTNFVEHSVANGTAIPSLSSEFLEKRKTIQVSEDEIRATADVAFTTYGAASDTTMSANRTFFYLMAVNPEIQKKAQQEIDQVIGSARLPDFADRPFLPYVDAIYREVMRWQQSLHLGAPHELTEDDYYKGYFIPKGTMVMGNIWAMSHDEDVYSDPYAFKPERYLEDNGRLPKNDRIFAYGYGRRICAGQHVASSIMWAIMASVLTCYEIGRDKDDFGNEIDINDEYITEGLLTHKKPFKCSIIPRAPIYRELIAESQKNIS
ncbi:cytochrome P450 [Pholiota conissans]|uniref:Cytochrome P450 n=1 Tax=Pholiota conissans TaxID=109636 RepID=A0A9P5YVS3_9AGAR|nr:cytochrome P450 [Pholiota conissans]